METTHIQTKYRGGTGHRVLTIIWKIQYAKTVFSNLVCADHESEVRFDLSQKPILPRDIQNIAFDADRWRSIKLGVGLNRSLFKC